MSLSLHAEAYDLVRSSNVFGESWDLFDIEQLLLHEKTNRLFREIIQAEVWTQFLSRYEGGLLGKSSFSDEEIIKSGVVDAYLSHLNSSFGGDVPYHLSYLSFIIFNQTSAKSEPVTVDVIKQSLAYKYSDCLQSIGPMARRFRDGLDREAQLDL